MRILLLGASGTIGSAVATAFNGGHTIIRAGRSGADVQVEMADPASIRAMYQQIGSVDAVVSCAGQARFKPLAELGAADFAFCYANKLMGQINLVRLGIPHVSDGGCFVLTSGVLAEEPIPGSAAIAMVNAGLHGFARAAALELPRALRIVVVSPPWVDVTLQKYGMEPVGGYPAATVARAYCHATLESLETGITIDARDFA